MPNVSILCEQLNISFKEFVDQLAYICFEDKQTVAYKGVIDAQLAKSKRTKVIFDKYSNDLIEHQDRLKKHDESVVTEQCVLLLVHLNVAVNWPRFSDEHRESFWTHLDQIVMAMCMVGASCAGNNLKSVENTAKTVVSRLANMGVLHDNVKPCEILDGAISELTEGDVFENISGFFKQDDMSGVTDAMRALGVDAEKFMPKSEWEAMQKECAAQQAAKEAKEAEQIEKGTAAVGATTTGEQAAREEEDEDEEEDMDNFINTIKDRVRQNTIEREMADEANERRRRPRRRARRHASEGESDSEYSQYSGSNSDSVSQSDDESRDDDDDLDGTAGGMDSGNPMFDMFAGNQNALFDAVMSRVEAQAGQSGAASGVDREQMRSMFSKMSSKLMSSNGLMAAARQMEARSKSDSTAAEEEDEAGPKISEIEVVADDIEQSAAAKITKTPVTVAESNPAADAGAPSVSTLDEFD